MWVKWCDLSILVIQEEKPDYAKIIKTYDRVGMKALTANLSKGMAKEYFFKAALCYLANHDLIGCNAALQNYACEDPSFENDRKFKFLVKLAEACDQRERELFNKTQ